MSEAAPPRRYPSRLAFWLAFVAVFSAIAYAANFAADGVEVDDPLYDYGTAIGGAIGVAFMLGVTLLIAGARKGPVRELLGLRRPRSWKRAIGLVVLVLVATYVLAGLISVLGLEPGEEQGLLPEEWEPDRAGAYATNFVVIAALVPVAEELLFRGLGFSLLRPFGAAVAIVGVGVLFAAAHGLVEAFPLLAALGAGLAWIRSHTASVLPPILLHSVFNALAMLAVFVAPD